MKETWVGLVIRTAEYGETGKLLTLLTADGKRTVSVSGAKGIKSRFILLSQLFSYGEYTVENRNGRCYVSDVALIENFYELFYDPLKLSLASYACEVANQVCVENGAEEEMLSLLLNILYVLTAKAYSTEWIKAAFEARVVAIQGIAPSVERCYRCGGDGGGMLYLDVMNGSSVCGDCLLAEEDAPARSEPIEEDGTARILLPMEQAASRALAYLLSCPPKKLFRYPVEERIAGTLSKLTETYLQNHLECRTRSIAMYRELLAQAAFREEKGTL